MTSVVYCLTNQAGSHTYVGVTNDMRRRLRQHNGALRGGARYTRRHKTIWRLLFVVDDLPDRRTALQLEWRLHRRALPSPRGSPFGRGAAGRRALQLQRALSMERVTASAPRSATLAPTITWHDPALSAAALGVPWPLLTVHLDAAATATAT